MWFIAVILSLIVKSEPSGIITSTINAFQLNGKYYPNIDDIFRSNAINYGRVVDKWSDIVFEEFNIYKIDNMNIYITDGVLSPKEGRRSSTVTRLSKDSGTQSKPSSFFGCSTGTLGVLTCNSSGQVRYVPMKMWFSQGFRPMTEWQGTPCEYAKMPTEQQEIEMAGLDFLKRNEDSVILADRASMSHNSFDRVAKLRDKSPKNIWLLTCCKSNTVAYTFPDSMPEQKGPGRPKLIGDRVALGPKGDANRNFKTATIEIYNRKEKVKYWSEVLLWGRKKRRKLRFVICMMSDGRRIILATDKLDMDPLTAIKLYSCRFLCEEGFKVLKHTFYAFDYHFWSKSMPWNSFMRKSGDPHPLESVTDKASQEMIMKEFRASTLALQMACIAHGVVQFIAQDQEVGGLVQRYTYKRTATKIKVSEHDVCTFLSKNLDMAMRLPKYKDVPFIRFIKARQRCEDINEICAVI